MPGKVLIIDDDVDMVEAEKMVLENNGYTVSTAYDGEEGYKKILEVNPDIIILDVMMATPEEGFQLAYKLKEDNKLSKIPIVMVTSVSKETGFKFDPQKDQDFLPVNQFIEKPIKPEELLEAIEKAMKSRN
ncbi:MAG: response regulator [Spirochaetes bacterium]|nr:MAG: response regulator [Spirochaetota bacterium]RKY03159.1 MAG: response regulator [Spirochaetota bacterium]